MRKPAIPLKKLFAACLIFAAYPMVYPAFSQSAAASGGPMAGQPPLSYADLVDLSEASSLVATVRVRNIIALKPDRAGTAAPGHRRAYIEGDVTAPIRGDGGISPTVAFLYDVPLDARGRIPKLKKRELLIFARPGARAGDVQLIAPDAALPADAATIARVRAILESLVAPGAPPAITGIGDAFHVSGTIAGEGETQIFLKTANNNPVSLSILRRPGQAPTWAVALGEIVDEAARAPQPGSLLWYRLACALPPTLPPASVRALPPQDADAARADYGVVIQSLGPCGRTRGKS